MTMIGAFLPVLDHLHVGDKNMQLTKITSRLPFDRHFVMPTM